MALLLRRVALGCLGTGAFVVPAVASAQEVRVGEVYARVAGNTVVLGNAEAERTWRRSSLRTLRLEDKRAGGRVWSRSRRDFTLRMGPVAVGSESFRVDATRIVELPGGGLRVEMRAEPKAGAPPVSVLRVAEAYPGIAGFRTQTTLTPHVPIVLTGATLAEADAGTAQPTIHAFRSGADWREPDWGGPPLTVGDPHPGTWRESRSGETGERIAGPAQWLSLARRGRSLFMVMERNDLPSSRASYNGRVARLEVDYTRDVALLGPLEENAHVENPFDGGPGRARVLPPGEPFSLEAAFTGFGASADDEPWQFHQALARRGRWRADVVFNSNGVDSNEISTGAKDDMDLAHVEEVAAVARALGVETFVLDDGWQARSGDWQPDSPQHPEPRGTPPRFPDAEFDAVRAAIAPMRLGLWMSPMHFHPSANAYRAHPDWVCHPAGDALVVYNTLDPEGGSNEAGIAQWSAAALPHVEARIREGIERWDVDYWKFDFLVWLDCAGAGDLYEMHDAFVAMLDRLRRDHPDVTFQIDETNDYRLFPFEATSRGPTWFQNGSPDVGRLLHNLWNLSPYVPPYSLGQHVLGGRAYERHPVDTLMAAALPSHITLFSDIRELPPAVVERAAEWIAFYKAHRPAFAQMAYPLLDDPLAGGWTALQPWNPETGEGALLAFRQGSPDATRRIALRNVPPGRTFELIRGPGGEPAGTVTSEQLAAGVDVTIDAADGAQALVIRPLEEAP